MQTQNFYRLGPLFAFRGIDLHGIPVTPLDRIVIFADPTL